MLHMLVSRGGFVLRKVRGLFAGCASFGLVTRRASHAVSLDLDTLLSFAGAVLIVAGCVALAIVSSHEHARLLADQSTMLLGVAGITATKTSKKSGSEEKQPANIRQMEKDLKSLLTELEQGQIELSNGPVTQERGEELEAKAMEAEALQENIDRYNRVAGITKNLRQVQKVTLPGESDNIRTKTIYTTPGHLFVASDEFQHFKRAGVNSGFSGKVSINGRLGQKAIRLMGEQAVEFERKAFDSANLPTIGADSIIPIDRDPEIVRYEDPEILTIRDVLNVTPTGSDVVRYVRHTATTRAAASQASRGDAKGYLKVTYDGVNATVQTIAVLSKVTEQDVADSPRLVGYINGEMSLDIRVQEEKQLVWGDGTSGTLVGLFDPTIDMPEFTRAAADDSIIDTVRKMRTDLRKKRVTPTFLLIDPVDWEEVELAKGSDLHYVWGLISDLRGPRIWSLRVVESDAMTNSETNERRLCVGDGVRGATIYDRSQIQLAVGFVDDDFGRNLRTLRAEERIALAVKRPWAFEFAITEAPES